MIGAVGHLRHLPFAGLLWAGWVRAADAPGRPEAIAPGNLLQVGMALLVVVGFILLTAWLLKRFGRLPQANGGPIRVLGGLSMGQRERIVLVEVGETQLLLGVAPGRVQTLHVLDKPIAMPTAEAQGFAARLRAATRGTPPS